jgi:hypothetical protein
MAAATDLRSEMGALIIEAKGSVDFDDAKHSILVLCKKGDDYSLEVVKLTTIGGAQNAKIGNTTYEMAIPIAIVEEGGVTTTLDSGENKLSDYCRATDNSITIGFDAENEASFIVDGDLGSYTDSEYLTETEDDDYIFKVNGKKYQVDEVLIDFDHQTKLCNNLSFYLFKDLTINRSEYMAINNYTRHLFADKIDANNIFNINNINCSTVFHLTMYLLGTYKGIKDLNLNDFGGVFDAKCTKDQIKLLQSLINEYYTIHGIRTDDMHDDDFVLCIDNDDANNVYVLRKKKTNGGNWSNAIYGGYEYL